ncbi:MAG: hypothetical protein RLZZ546_881 [Bacteroidota bacterium]|jgi:outer membrane protein
MKQFTLIIVCISFVMISCKKNEATTGASKSEQTLSAETSSQPKIVFIQMDSLIEKYDLYIQQKKSLETQSAADEKRISSQIESFQKRLMKFQQDVYAIQQKAATIAPIELKALEEKYAAQEKELMNEEKALMKQRDDAGLALDKKLNEVQKKLTQNIDDYLSKIAKERNYDYILRKGSIGGVMVGKPEFDITNEVVKALNENMKEVKK